MDRETIAARANECARLSRYGSSAPSLSVASPREALTEWLQWCDPNGIHTDELAAIEDCDPYTLDSAWDAIAAMLADT